MENKILHIRSTIGMYGAEQVILNISGIADKCNFDTSVLIIEGVNTESSGLRRNLSIISATYDHIISSKRLDVKVIKKIKEMAKNVTIVHTHDYKSLILASLSLFFTNIKIVHHIHGALGNTRSEIIYSYLERIFMLNAKKIITVSNDQKCVIKKRLGLKNKVIQIDNGTTIYDRKKIISKHSDKILMVMAARFTAEKDHKKAVDIVAQLISKKISVELILLGSGPEMEDIKQYSKECSVEKSIKFAGFTVDVKKWLDDSHLMLITSTTEGLPMSMLEAMSSGLPIISTPVGEIPNILRQSKGGWIAKTAEEFSKKIIDLTNSREELDAAGDNAYIFAKENLSTERQVSRIEDIYKAVIGGEK